MFTVVGEILLLKTLWSMAMKKLKIIHGLLLSLARLRYLGVRRFAEGGVKLRVKRYKSLYCQAGVFHQLNEVKLSKPILLGVDRKFYGSLPYTS